MKTNTEPLLDIGAVKRLKVLCISETGWRDTATLLADIKTAGDVNTNQYKIAWPPFGDLHPENAAGSSALIEVQALNGTVHKFLFDTGWSAEWMERRFAEGAPWRSSPEDEVEGGVFLPRSRTPGRRAPPDPVR